MIGFYAAGAVGAVGPALWTPLNLSAPPKIYFDDRSAITVESGGVSQWTDRSGNGYNAIQTGSARRPIIIENATGGRRCLRFDGVDDCLVVSGTGADVFRNTGAGWSLTVTRKRTALTPSGSACLIYANASSSASETNRFNIISARASTPGIGAFASRRLLSDSTAILGRTSSDTGNWVTRMDSSDWINGVAQTRVNGSIDSTNSTTMTKGVTSNVACPGIYVSSAGNGGFIGNPNSFSDADFACLIIGSGSLPTATEIDKLFGWSAWHFGLQGSLPAGHPYKSAPPYL